jgi:hypothetical protein
MEVPHDVHTKSIQPHCLDHLYPMLPILHRDPRVVQLSCVDFLLPHVGSGWEDGFERAVFLGSVDQS